MRLVIVGLTCVALAAGAAAATPAELRPTLSFTIGAGVSDSGFAPLGGGICLGGRRITEPRPDGGIAWSPDGSRVAFYRQTGSLTADVFVADANGAHLRNLSQGSAKFSWLPDWSPDGSRIVYIAGDEDVAQLVAVRPDGSDRRPIPGTAVNPNELLGTPRWSPDGSVIAYSVDTSTYVIRPDGTERRLLLTNAYGLDWSPDARRIAFTRDRDLALANSDGSGVVAVTRTPNLFEGGASFSPDGASLVYVSIDETDPRVGGGPGDHMYLTNADGRNRRALRGPRGIGAWSPAWRPAASAPRGTRPCAFLGTPRADVLVGSAKGDLILAGGGNDVVRGRGGDDIIVGDVPFARARGKDRLFGGPGRDYIDSYDGRRDVVDGGSGRDRGISDRHDLVRSVERYG